MIVSCFWYCTFPTNKDRTLFLNSSISYSTFLNSSIVLLNSYLSIESLLLHNREPLNWHIHQHSMIYKHLKLKRNMNRKYEYNIVFLNSSNLLQSVKIFFNTLYKYNKICKQHNIDTIIFDILLMNSWIKILRLN